MLSGWVSYESAIDEKPALFRVDMDALVDAPDANRPHLLIVALEIKEPDEDGLPGEAEADRLQLFCMQLKRHWESDFAARVVGWVIHEGQWQLFSYMPDVQPAIEKDLRQRMLQLPGHDFVAEWENDPGWLYYSDFLYPSPLEMQHLFNEQKIEQLRQQGDDLERPRPVHHWLLFQTMDDCEACIRKVAEWGYRTVRIIQPGDDERSPLREQEEPHSILLEIERLGPVDAATIHDQVDELIVAAEETQGLYDGWDASPCQKN